MRIHPNGNPLWKWWWPLGGVAVAALIVVGVIVSWSASLWAAAGVVAVVYVGAPVTAATLGDLTSGRKPLATSTAAQSGANTLSAAMGPAGGTPVPDSLPEATVAVEPSTAGDGVYRLSGGAVDTDASNTTWARSSPPSADPPSREVLQRRIAAMSRPPPESPGQPGGRPWRRVGSRQFAKLVWALGKALPSVSQANATAVRAGVTLHLITGGEDNAVERWQAVLVQAIDDEADDAVCADTLNLTNSAQLRAAVADWIGAPGDAQA